jgi:hypothetical protein
MYPATSIFVLLYLVAVGFACAYLPIGEDAPTN